LPCSASPSLRAAAPAVSYTLSLHDALPISPALPALREHFAGEPGIDLLVRLVLSMPALVIALTAPLVGLLAERLSKQRVLCTATIIFGLAGTAGLFLDSLFALIVSRALLGLGVAGIMTTTSALVGDYFAPADRARFVGLQISCSGLGGLLFVGGGGILADLSWRAPFAIYALALLLPPAILAFLPRARAADTAAPIIDAAPIPAPHLAVMGLFAVGLLNSVAWYMVASQLPFRLVEMGIAQASMAGYAIGLLTLVSAASPLLVRWLYGRMPTAAILAAGLALMAVSFLLIASAQGYLQILAGMLLTGFGLGMVTPVLLVSLL